MDLQVQPKVPKSTKGKTIKSGERETVKTSRSGPRVNLQGQCHEILDLSFLFQTVPLRPRTYELMNLF